MRKLVLYCMLCLCFIQPIKAQLKLSVSAGMNLTNGRHKGDFARIRFSSIYRFSAGADLTYLFDENWGIQSGLNYQGKGWKEKIGGFDSVFVRLNYIELPLKGMYRFKSNTEKNFAFSSGLYCSYGFKGKITFSGSPERTYDPFKEKLYKRFDFGYLIESSLFIKNNYGAKLGYSHGLLKLDRPGGIIRNYVFNVSLVWLFIKK